MTAYLSTNPLDSFSSINNIVDSNKCNSSSIQTPEDMRKISGHEKSESDKSDNSDISSTRPTEDKKLLEILSGEEENKAASDASVDQDSVEGASKKQRTNYRDPSRLANIKAAIDFLLQQENLDGTSGGKKIRNLKEVSRQFKIPYNTLRDNFLRFMNYPKH